MVFADELQPILDVMHSPPLVSFNTQRAMGWAGFLFKLLGMILVFLAVLSVSLCTRAISLWQAAAAELIFGLLDTCIGQLDSTQNPV